MHHEMMTVTPELAIRWLEEKNNRNRSISPKKVDAYASDMADGRWVATHQNAIAFYKDGNLADGQHRLAAIAKAGMPTELMVWWGLDDKSAYGIDAHRMRATHDQVRIAGGNDWINKDVIACARMMMPETRGRAGVVSPQRIVEFCVPHKEALLFASQNLPKNTGPASLRAAVAISFYHVARRCLVDWCDVMATGVGAVPLSKTVLTLRERMLREPHLRSGGGTHREYVLKTAMRSIEAYCDGQVLTKIYEPKERIYALPE